nr:glutaredoxin [Quercus suber]
MTLEPPGRRARTEGQTSCGGFTLSWRCSYPPVSSDPNIKTKHINHTLHHIATVRFSCRSKNLSRLPITNFLRHIFSGARPTSPAAMSAAKTKAQAIIDDNAVAVFSKSYCPYCTSTKRLLSEMGVKPYIIELDQVDDGAAIQDALEEITHQRTVPNVFIDHKHIGGNSDLQGKRSQLPELLKTAGAL